MKDGMHGKLLVFLFVSFTIHILANHMENVDNAKISDTLNKMFDPCQHSTVSNLYTNLSNSKTMPLQLGDVNADGLVDAQDLESLANGLAEGFAIINFANADLNKNMRLDLMDLMLLQKALAGTPVLSFTCPNDGDIVSGQVPICIDVVSPTVHIKQIQLLHEGQLVTEKSIHPDITTYWMTTIWNSLPTKNGSTALTAVAITDQGATNQTEITVTVMNENILLESPFGFHPASIAKQGYSNNGYGDAQNIGVTWTREGLYAYWFLIQPDLARPVYDFSLYDKQWGRVPVGMKIFANIAPQGPIDQGRCLENSYFPVEEQKYINFVKEVVHRYSGDSFAAAGLVAPIKYWQVGNEPGKQKSGFADLQRITYTAIKAVCPDCIVFIGGVPGMPPAANYITNFNQYYKPILDALKGEYVDAMDFHWYGNATGDYLGAREVYDYIRSVLDVDGFPTIPFWITEMGAYSGDPVPTPISYLPVDYILQTERQQALDYFKRFVYSLSFGIKKIFPAFGIMEGFQGDGGYFDYTGLIYNGLGTGDLGLGVKKLGYYTYKKMTEMLEGSDWNSIQTIRHTDDVYIFKLIKNGNPIHVAWWDYFNDPMYTPGKTKQVSLFGLQGASVIVTAAVPRYGSGAEVTDYTSAFNTDILTITNGEVTLYLGDSPVFMEERQ